MDKKFDYLENAIKDIADFSYTTNRAAPYAVSNMLQALSEIKTAFYEHHNDNKHHRYLVSYVVNSPILFGSRVISTDGEFSSQGDLINLSKLLNSALSVEVTIIGIFKLT